MNTDILLRKDIVLQTKQGFLSSLLITLSDISPRVISFSMFQA